jgi:putative transposase
MLPLNQQPLPMSGDRYYITNQHESYFITCTVTEWIDLFTRPVYKQIIVDSLNYCIATKGLILNGWVIMSNHIHFAGRCSEPNRMSDFLRDFRKFTSKEFIKAIVGNPESRREWLLDKFAFEARRSGRADHYKVWRDDNHAIELSSIDVRKKLDIFMTIRFVLA